MWSSTRSTRGAVVRVRHAPRARRPGAAGRADRARRRAPSRRAAQVALGAGDDQQLVALAVERVQRVDRRAAGWRGRPRSSRASCGMRLERAGEVVAQRAEQAAAERRRARRHVGGEPVEQFARLAPARPPGRAARARRRATARGTTSDPRPTPAGRCPARPAPQRRRRLDAARRDGVREHAGARSQSRAHAVTVAPARPSAPPPPTPSRRAASRSGAARRSAGPSSSSTSLRPRGEEVSSTRRRPRARRARRAAIPPSCRARGRPRAAPRGTRPAAGRRPTA